MKNFNTILKHSALNGAILGAALLVFTLLTWVFEVNIFSFGFAAVSFVVVFGGEIFYTVWAEKKYRSSVGGVTDFGELFLYGVIMLLVAGLISAIFSYILYNFIDTDYLSRQADHFGEMMENYITDEDILDQTMTKLNESLDKMHSFWRSLSGIWVGPLIISLILALIIKKDTTENQ